MLDSYPPELVEELLQAGELQAALDKGWFGDEWHYRLIRSAALPTISISIGQTTKDIGLDVRNDDGVATLGEIMPGCACDGQLKRGDVIRSVNGKTHFTCEGTVKAIKAWRRQSMSSSSAPTPTAPLALEAVRPPTLHVWRDEVEIGAGAHNTLRFSTTQPTALTYSWRSLSGYDVGFSVVRLGGSAKSLKSKSELQTSVVDTRDVSGRGSVVLPEAGNYAFGWSNQHAMWRGKRVRYMLRCVPLDAWEACKQVERLTDLETECAKRKAKSRELTASLAQHEARLEAVKVELASAEAALEAARRDKEENSRLWKEARSERDALRKEQEQQAAAAAEAQAG